MSEQDCLDSWSSDGDSVSSDSYSSDSETSSSSSSNNSDNQSSDRTRGVRYLKHVVFVFTLVYHGSYNASLPSELIFCACISDFRRRAGIFTREEVIEQAIDRWSAYLRLCGKAMTFLRDTMVENYVREVVENKAQSNFSCPIEAVGGGVTSKITPSVDSLGDSKNSTLASGHKSAELRALRRFGRHSSRVENAKRAAAVSKFAIMSTQLAPWQRSGGGQQSCKYRDPTTTTWEHRCNRPCVPLLPYCAVHLVLSEDTPSPPQPSNVATTTSTTILPRETEVGGDGEGFSVMASASAPAPPPTPGKPQKPPSRKSASTKARSTTDGVASFSDVQFPPQVCLLL
ncbi:unnamed protein product [Hydatigera taeniaeformis]|uniref:Uncharacterized protein n=1 Tax=Hydatigena taeniaeformis TaxID=6205 RepID=A0A0R3WP80_HYDTA|nr:unnamed protein product [Hydatigera taeniaeformis]